MKTNKLMDEIRKSTPADTNKQVDLCVAIANRVFELLQERNMKQRDFAKALGKTETCLHPIGQGDIIRLRF